MMDGIRKQPALKVVRVEQPRIAVATTSTSQIRVALRQPATYEEGAGHAGVYKEKSVF